MHIKWAVNQRTIYKELTVILMAASKIVLPICVQEGREFGILLRKNIERIKCHKKELGGKITKKRKKKSQLKVGLHDSIFIFVLKKVGLRRI